MTRFRLLLPLVLCAVLALPGLSACGEDVGTPASPTPVDPEAVADPTEPGTDAAEPDTGAEDGTKSPTPEADLSGRTIAIDPGHNGGNASHASEIARPVPDGRGGTKACNTTGTATASDFPETDFTWAVAGILTESLEDAGAEVVLSRHDNDGVGPCVDERGTFADDADVLVSIHANGSESTSVKGFHVIVAKPGTSADVEEDSDRLAKSLSASMGESFTPNTAYGKQAISRRPDLAGLNNASVPAVIVECGEMRNPEEAKLMEEKSGQQKYADALLHGILDWF